MTTLHDIQSFLEQFFTSVRFREAGCKKPMEIRNTPKNIQARIDLGGITEHDTQECILALKVENYVKGPEPDRDEDNKEIWVFGCEYNNKEVYIKLRLDPTKPFAMPVVRSFHPAEHPMDYPPTRK